MSEKSVGIPYMQGLKTYFLQSNETGKEVKGMYMLSTPVIMVKYVYLCHYHILTRYQMGKMVSGTRRILIVNFDKIM